MKFQCRLVSISAFAAAIGCSSFEPTSFVVQSEGGLRATIPPTPPPPPYQAGTININNHPSVVQQRNDTARSLFQNRRAAPRSSYEEFQAYAAAEQAFTQYMSSRIMMPPPQFPHDVYNLNMQVNAPPRNIDAVVGARYTVPFGEFDGSRRLRFGGDWAQDRSCNVFPRPPECNTHWLGVFGGIADFMTDTDTDHGGWNFHPEHRLKYRTVMTDQEEQNTQPRTVRCTYRPSIELVGAEGAIIFYPRDLGYTFTEQAGSCGPDPTTFPSNLPSAWWSTTGQVAIDMQAGPAFGATPPTEARRWIVRYPDGRTEHFVESLTERVIDRNGNVTRFQAAVKRDGAGKLVASLERVIDPRGRITEYEWEPSAALLAADGDPRQADRFHGMLRSITQPGVGGAARTYTFTWSQRSWKPHAVMPDVHCQSFAGVIFGNPVPHPLEDTPCPEPDRELAFITLARIDTPEGLAYTFEYNVWGGLLMSTAPDGSVTTFEYGDAGTPTQLPFEPNSLDDQSSPYRYTPTLHGRRVVAQTFYARGTAGPALRTTFADEPAEKLNAPAGVPGLCGTVMWSRSVTDTGKITRTGKCGERAIAASNTPFVSGITDQVIATETLVAEGNTERLVSATYYGNLGRNHDTGSAIGTLYHEAKPFLVTTASASQISLDHRTTRSIHVRRERTLADPSQTSEVWWTETFSYDPSQVSCAGGPTGPRFLFGDRGADNPVLVRTFRWDGTLEKEIRRAYNATPGYIDRNLIRLPVCEEVLGEGFVTGTDAPAFRRLTLDESLYDQSVPTATGIPGSSDPTTAERRVDVGNVRGNVTTTIGYAGAVARTGAVTHTTRYFDNGAVAESTDGRGGVTSHQQDFGACSTSHVVTTATTTSPQVAAGIVHATTTANDCFTDLALSRRDPNGRWSCTQYDAEGRVIETAVPGDTLTDRGAGFVRDPDTEHCKLGGAPTTRVSYDRDVVASQTLQRRTEVVKNGGTGITHVAYSDAAGRTLYNCKSVDPSEYPGQTAICTWTLYDAEGQITATTVPAFGSASSAQALTPPLDLAVTRTAYDAQGRVASVMEPGNRVTTTDHRLDGEWFVTLTTRPDGAVSRKYAAASGRASFSAQAWSGCSDGRLGPGWCVTDSVTDGLGRVWRTSEPVGTDGKGGYVTVRVYDDLGRTRSIDQPDVGLVEYTYDAEGNRKTMVTPGRTAGERLTFQYDYDALNRMIRKTLPYARNPDEQIVTWSFDGQGAMPPNLPAADAEALATDQLGRLTSVGNGLTRRWTSYDALGRQTAVFTQIDDGRVFVAHTRYRYPADAAGVVSGPGTVTARREVPHLVGAAAETISYLYDATGVMQSMFTERPLAGPAQVASPQPQMSFIVNNRSHDAAGRATEVVFSNGIRTRRTYSSTDRSLASIRTVRPKVGGEDVLQALDYSFNRRGVVDAVVDHCDPTTGVCDTTAGATSASYRYDALDRLIAMHAVPATGLVRGADGSIVHGAQLRSWAYDATDDVTVMSGVDGDVPQTYFGRNGGRPAHAVATAGGASYSYDPRGNLITSAARPGGDLAITWNAENMSERVTTAGVVRDKWFLGEAMWKRREGDLVTYYLGSALLECRGSDCKSRVYYDDFAESDPDAGNALRFHHRDFLGSASVITDPAGAVIDRAAYWPFGGQRSPANDTNRVFKPRFRFGFHEFEPVTQTYDFGARVYDPALGRWLSADSNPTDGANRYTFARNNPLTVGDPDGHVSCFIDATGKYHCIDPTLGYGWYSHQDGSTQFRFQDGLLMWHGFNGSEWVWYANTDWANFQSLAGVHWMYTSLGQSMFRQTMHNNPTMQFAHRYVGPIGTAMISAPILLTLGSAAGLAYSGMSIGGSYAAGERPSLLQWAGLGLSGLSVLAGSGGGGLLGSFSPTAPVLSSPAQQLGITLRVTGNALRAERIANDKMTELYTHFVRGQGVTAYGIAYNPMTGVMAEGVALHQGPAVVATALRAEYQTYAAAGKFCAEFNAKNALLSALPLSGAAGYSQPGFAAVTTVYRVRLTYMIIKPPCEICQQVGNIPFYGRLVAGNWRDGF